MRSSFLAERPLNLVQAAKIVPGNPHKNTIRRWCHKGFRGIRLRSFYSGNALCTSVVAIEEFLMAINPQSAPSPTSHAHKLAEQRLDELGV